MNAMTYRGYRARVDFDDEDNILVGHIVGINDVVGFHAESVPELQNAFHEAVDDYLLTCIKVGKPAERTFSGQLMVRIAADVHAKAALVAELEGVSLAKWTETALREAAERHLLDR